MLFDEIEKAHEDVYNLLLQIMEDGRLTDSAGRRADFRSTIVVMTSNIGAKAITENRPALGFSGGAGDRDSKVKEAVMAELRQTFRPEFLNRVDDTIVFSRLSREDVLKIARGMTDAVCERMRALGIELQVSGDALALLAERGFDPSYGARPLRRQISALLEDPAADAILSAQVSPGDKMCIRDRDIYLVAQLSCCTDALMATRCPTAALTTQSGVPYSDSDGTWLDPYNSMTADYLVQLCTELADMGFDELLLKLSLIHISTRAAGWPSSG